MFLTKSSFGEAQICFPGGFHFAVFSFLLFSVVLHVSLQFFDAVCWLTGRLSGL